MRRLYTKFKIPTVLGLGIIIFGIAAGTYLTLKEQNFISKASPDILPQNINISNISDDSATISWTTSTAATSFVNFGIKDPNEQVVLDDRDIKIPQPHKIHYVTIKNLLPKTEYQYKLISGKLVSEINKFQTATPLSSQTGLRPIIGTVLNGDQPLKEGIAYLTVADATTQSSLIKNEGNFIIPISQIRKSDLSEGFSLTEDTLFKLTIISDREETNVLFKFKDSNQGLPLIKLGESLDLTSNIATSSGALGYDLNSDGKVNAADNAIILQNFGKNPKNKKADLNRDGIVDQKDLDLMSKQINQ